jgi:hypothetical protein
MTNCKQCNEPLTHTDGRKKKQFCGVNCRNKYFYAQRKEVIELVRKSLIALSLPEDCATIKNIGILSPDGSVKPFPKPNKKKDKEGAVNGLKNDSWNNTEWAKGIIENTEFLKRDYMSKKHLSDLQTKDRIDLALMTPATNNVSRNTIPPIPVRGEKEDALDFAARKNEWKKLYGK